MIVEYDACGRMKYNPEFHEQQGTAWSEEDLEYACKYHDIDDLETLSLALGRTKTTVATKLTTLKNKGKFDYYRTLNKHW